MTVEDNTAIFVDESIEVESLQVTEGSELNVTQVGEGDLTVSSSRGMAIGGTASSATAETALFGGAGLSASRVLVANDRVVSVPNGPISIRTAGSFGPAASAGFDGCPTARTCAQLLALRGEVFAGDCTQLTSGGSLELDHAMAASFAGDLTIVGSDGPVCGALNVASALGVTPPPRLYVRGDGVVASTPGADEASIEADSLDMDGAVETLNDSGIGIILRGDFNNQTVYPHLFDWSEGELFLDGTATQHLEAAGIDLGSTFDGFDTTEPTLYDSVPHTNYSLGRLRVGSDSTTVIANSFANTVGVGTCEEAIYIGELHLMAGSQLTVDNVRVYYASLVDEGATIDVLGCGQLVNLCAMASALTGEPDKVRFVSFTDANPGRQTAVRVIPQDLPAPFDGLNGHVWWLGFRGSVRCRTDVLDGEPWLHAGFSRLEHLGRIACLS